MSTPEFLSIADQVAEHLRGEIRRGRWSHSLPGKHQLAAELGVNNKTVETALRQLESAGVLISQGTGRRRRISPGPTDIRRSLRIAYLPDEAGGDLHMGYRIELHHALAASGHTEVQVPKSMSELRFDPVRIAKMVRQTRADAWIVAAGARPVLEWFAAQPVPTFALFGQRAGLCLPGAGPDKPPAMAEASRHLLSLGHRRIVLLCRKIRRFPKPGTTETAFLDELRAHGVTPGRYNLPDWEETPAGFQVLLDSLFQITPPTGLIVDEAPHYVAVMHYLCRRGIRVPSDVSLVCTDDDPAFAFCDPAVSRLRWDSRPVIHRIQKWAANVSRHRPDFQQTLTPCVFLPGGTTAAPRRA